MDSSDPSQRIASASPFRLYFGFYSLRTEADPHGGIFTLADMVLLDCFYVLFVVFLSYVSRHASLPPNRIRRASPLECMRISIVYLLYWICQKGGTRNRYREGADIGSKIRGSYLFIISFAVTLGSFSLMLSLQWQQD